MVRTSYEWITKSQCILNLQKKLSMWHNLFMLYQKWHNAVPPAGRHTRWRLFKIITIKKTGSGYFQLCGYCCSTSSEAFSFQVLCKWPLQTTAAALLYEMLFLFFFVISFLKNIYISFYVFKVNGLNFFLLVCVCVKVNVPAKTAQLLYTLLFL